MAKFSERDFRGEIGALAEEIRSEIASSSVPSFRDWCHAVSPSMRWDWPHLGYIRQKLQPRIDDLEAALKGDVTEHPARHLILSVPPRHGKSEQVTVRLPAYLLERWPQLRCIVGAYSASLADEFSRKTRRIAAPRVALAPDRKAANDWQTVVGGGMRSVGVGGGVTGRGAHLIVIDDPVKSREEAESEAYRRRVWSWFTDDMYTRLEPGGVIILIMTRWHEDDLAGRIVKSDFAQDFEVINLAAEAEYGDPLGRPPGAALCPDRFNEEALARLRKVLGRSYFALYQGRPAALASMRFWSSGETLASGHAVPAGGVGSASAGLSRRTSAPAWTTLSTALVNATSASQGTALASSSNWSTAPFAVARIATQAASRRSFGISRILGTSRIRVRRAASPIFWPKVSIFSGFIIGMLR